MMSTCLRILTLEAMLTVIPCMSDSYDLCKDDVCKNTTVDRPDYTIMLQHSLHQSQSATAPKSEKLEFIGLSSWKTMYGLLSDEFPIWEHAPKAVAQDAQLAKHDSYNTGVLSAIDKSVDYFGVASGFAVYLASLTLGGLIVVLISWSFGALAISKILGYLGFGCMMTLSVKLVYQDRFGFKYPWLLTTFHMLATSIVGFTILFLSQAFPGSMYQDPNIVRL